MLKNTLCTQSFKRLNSVMSKNPIYYTTHSNYLQSLYQSLGNMKQPQDEDLNYQNEVVGQYDSSAHPHWSPSHLFCGTGTLSHEGLFIPKSLCREQSSGIARAALVQQQQVKRGDKVSVYKCHQFCAAHPTSLIS